jgi:undecaprenyl-diphosphatase
VDPLAALLGRRRRAALITAAGALAAVVGLGAVVAGGSAPTGFDRVVRDWLAGWLPTGTARTFSDFGSVGVVIPVIAFAALAFAVRRWFRGVVLVVLAPAVSVALVEVAKPLFDRTSGVGLAYPSGHTAAASAVALALVVTVTGPARFVLSPMRGAIVAVASGLFVLAGMAGLVVAGYHYATDTIGGLALALATTLLLAAAIDGGAERSRPRRAAPGADRAVVRPVEKSRR